jgi:deazaflavin-dependent oxidoreductase (nitroreductase family)
MTTLGVRQLVDRATDGERGKPPKSRGDSCRPATMRRVLVVCRFARAHSVHGGLGAAPPAMDPTVRRKPAGCLAVRACSAPDRPVVFRMTGGRRTATSVNSGPPVVMLTTTGARTGLPRTVPVLGFPLGDDIAIAAGNFGPPEAPGWCVNLRGDPRAGLVVDGQRRGVREVRPSRGCSPGTDLGRYRVNPGRRGRSPGTPEPARGDRRRGPSPPLTPDCR